MSYWITIAESHEYVNSKVSAPSTHLTTILDLLLS